VLVGGSRRDGPGYFLTTLRCSPGVPPGRPACLVEEIFGPVAPVVPFDTDEEAIALPPIAPSTPPLVSYVYTRDLQRAFSVCEAIEKAA